MITTTLATAGTVGEPAISGYTTIPEALHGLAESWPIILVEREQYAVLADYQWNAFLVLEQSTARPGVATGHHPATRVGRKFDMNTDAGLRAIIEVAGNSHADTFWLQTGVRPCELIAQLASALLAVR